MHEYDLMNYLYTRLTSTYTYENQDWRTAANSGYWALVIDGAR